jgi:hypothetical protein
MKDISPNAWWFTHKTGFSDKTLAVVADPEVDKPQTGWLVSENSHVPAYEYPLESCLRLVREGIWIEMTEAEITRRLARLNDKVPRNPPTTYLAWHAWAEKQYRAGRRQKKCPGCGLWLFPQESRAHVCPARRKSPQRPNSSAAQAPGRPGRRKAHSMPMTDKGWRRALTERINRRLAALKRMKD